MNKNIMVIFLAGIMVVGCVPGGFNQGYVRSDLSGQRLMVDKDIQTALSKQSQLSRPFRLGIYCLPPGNPGGEYRRHSLDWDWNEGDKEKILGAVEKLKLQGIVSEAVFISDSLVPDKNTEAIRFVAAQHGLDAVLVVRGILNLDSSTNALAPLYIFFITGVFVPGNELDAHFISHAALWDVRNGFLYLSVETEGKGHETAPAFTLREKKPADQAKAQALTSLCGEIENRLISLALAPETQDRGEETSSVPQSCKKNLYFTPSGK
jgi:hypothetical protein